MQYQLPNGKVIRLSVEDYLKMTPLDIQYLISINSGEYVSNPWSESVLSNPEEIDKIESELLDEESYFEDYFPEEYEDDNISISIDE